MELPNQHSIANGSLKLKSGQWRCFIAIRGVSKKNIRQAKAHLSRCNNIESHHCKCHEVQ